MPAERVFTPRLEAANAAERPERRSRWLAWVVVALVLAVGGWVAAEAVWTIRVDLTSMHARREVLEWLDNIAGARGAGWERARRELMAAQALAPENPQLLEELGHLYFIRSLALEGDAAQQHELLAAALAYQEKSLALMPHNSGGWAQLASLRQSLGQPRERVAADWNRSLHYGRHEREVQRLLAYVALAGWSEASPEMKAWVRDRYREAHWQAELKERAEQFTVSLEELAG